MKCLFVNLVCVNIFRIFLGESSFHFLPMSSSSTTSLGDKTGSGSRLYREVPALFGVHTRRQTAAGNSSPLNLSSSSSSSGNGGFYKRLLEWLSRKNKSRRRFSEAAVTEGTARLPSSLRNQSAPMIFDVYPRTPAVPVDPSDLTLSAARPYGNAPAPAVVPTVNVEQVGLQAPEEEPITTEPHWVI